MHPVTTRMHPVTTHAQETQHSYLCHVPRSRQCLHLLPLLPGAAAAALTLMMLLLLQLLGAAGDATRVLRGQGRATGPGEEHIREVAGWPGDVWAPLARTGGRFMLNMCVPPRWDRS
jgi:hypothetical protein